MAVVRRDQSYYASSGGGLTLTGGEPLAQPDLCVALLEQAKSEGIHTCVETCGCASRGVIERILPYVDLFLFDIKASGNAESRLLTGAPEELPLTNLAFIIDQGIPTWLRCPLVPGINDSREHLARIANLAAQYPQVEGVDLLPYHNIGNGKYAEFGMQNPLPNLASTTESEKQRWLEELHRLGCTKAAFG